MEELGWELSVSWNTVPSHYVSQTDTNRLENKMSPVIGEHPHTRSHSWFPGCTCPSSPPALLTQKMEMLAESSASSCLTIPLSECSEDFTLHGQYNMSPRWHLTTSLVSWTTGSSFSQGVLGIGFSRPLLRTVRGFLFLGSSLLGAIENLGGMVGQVMGNGLGWSQKNWSWVAHELPSGQWGLSAASPGRGSYMLGNTAFILPDPEISKF